MAKVKESEYLTWEDVNAALKKMGEIDIQVSKLEGEMTLKINEIKAAYDIKSQGLSKERKLLENNIILFAESNKEDFAKTRHKELTFGRLAYRVTSKITIKSKAACVNALKALNMLSYIRVIEEPDKEALDGLDPVTLAKVGANKKIEDKLRIEPNLESFKDLA